MNATLVDVPLGVRTSGGAVRDGRWDGMGGRTVSYPAEGGLRSLHAKTTSVHRVFVKEIGTANFTPWEKFSSTNTS